MSQAQEHLRLGAGASACVDAYLEYRRIVGDDDGGRLMSPEEYEKYKKEVLPVRARNRLYVSWTSPTGMDCKLVGPETMCFCQHRYKQHKTDFKELPSTRPILVKCRVKGCSCSSFIYVPTNGTQSIRCHCKHYASDHGAANPHLCRLSGCSCSGFKTSFTCGCGYKSSDHETIMETREERLKRGHPVGQEGVPYAAMGGLTGFSSLMDGYLRLDDSGVGAPSKEWLEQPSGRKGSSRRQLKS